VLADRTAPERRLLVLAACQCVDGFGRVSNMLTTINDMTEPALIERLASASDAELDALDFGVIKMDSDGRVLAYNAYESVATGLSRERVLCRPFFTEIGLCMNNALVAERFAKEDKLDMSLDYLFTLHMKPSPVRLRLLKSAKLTARFILVRR
jgi:photoactive yellow protein